MKISKVASLRSRKSPTPPAGSPTQSTRFQSRLKGQQGPLFASPFAECESDAEAAAPMEGFEGLMALSSYNNTIVFICDAVVFKMYGIESDEAPRHVELGTLRRSYLERANSTTPYLLLDNTTTGCTKSVVVDGPCASSSHESSRSHGTVLGTLFHEGVHVWHLRINDLSLVSVGLVSAVGVGELVKNDGSRPDFISCLRRSPFGDYKMYHSTDLKEECHLLLEEVDCEVDCTLDVTVSFPCGVLSFSNNGVFLGSVTVGSLVGEHTIGIYMKSGAKVEMVYNPTAPITQLVSKLDDFAATPVCGNPLVRWKAADGEGPDVSFSLPLGIAACNLFGEDVALVTDRNVIRVLKEGACMTIGISINEVLQESNDLLLGGIIHGGALQPVYVTDLWNQTVMQVTPSKEDVWEAVVVVRRCFVSPGLGDVRAAIHTAWVEGVMNTAFGHRKSATRQKAKKLFSAECPAGGPWALAVMGTWVFITDTRRHCIFGWNSALPTQEAINVAGSPGSPGEREGWGAQCKLRSPTGMVADDQGLCLYVCDTGNRRVVKILLRYYSERYEGCLVPLDPVNEENEPVALSAPVALSLHISSTSKHLLVSDCYARRVVRVSLIAAISTQKSQPSISAPLEQILEMLKGLKSSAGGKSDYAFILDEVIDLLGRGKNIYSAKLVARDMDEELAGWLRAAFVESETQSPYTSPVQDTPTTWRRPSIKEDNCMVYAIQDGPERRKVDIKGLHGFAFNIFEWEEHCEQHGGLLFQVMLNIFHDYGFRDKLGVDRNQMMAFCRVVQVGYQRNPYHNCTHAADVLQTVHALLTETGLASKFTTIEILALFTAAAIHDYDHPGVSNQFLIATRDPLAVRYNDNAVLENYHVAQVYECFQNYPSCDWTQSLPLMEQGALRELMISLILATDMKQHFTLLGQFKRGIDSNKKGEYSEEEKRILLKTLLHAADISNPTKPPQIYIEWAARVMQEFGQQGVSEAENEIPYSPFCEPGPDIKKCQRGFIEFVVRPQYAALVSSFPCLKPLLVRLELNYDSWE